MNFIMIGLLLREELDRLCVRLNMYLVIIIIIGVHTPLTEISIELQCTDAVISIVCISTRGVIEAEHMTAVVRCVFVANTTDLISLVANVHLQHSTIIIA